MTQVPPTPDLQARLRRSRMAIVILAVIVVFLLIVVVAQATRGTAPFAGLQSDDQEVAGSQSEVQKPNHQTPYIRGIEGDPMAIGDIDAPVVMVEWTDYRCPFCAVFTNETLPTLIREYVDKGLLRIEFNDVAFFGEDSLSAAVAARAAANQGKYLDFMEALYADAPEQGHPDMPREKLIGFAEAAGVSDMAKFQSDLDSPDLYEAVQSSQSQAQQWGIQGVPAFVVAGQYFSGAQPLETFRQLIDEQLGE